MKKRNAVLFILFVVFMVLAGTGCSSTKEEPKPENKKNMEEKKDGENSSFNILERYNINI